MKAVPGPLHWGISRSLLRPGQVEVVLAQRAAKALLGDVDVMVGEFDPNELAPLAQSGDAPVVPDPVRDRQRLVLTARGRVTRPRLHGLDDLLLGTFPVLQSLFSFRILPTASWEIRFFGRDAFTCSDTGWLFNSCA